jgi:hypothetical protein
VPVHIQDFQQEPFCSIKPLYIVPVSVLREVESRCHRQSLVISTENKVSDNSPSYNWKQWGLIWNASGGEEHYVSDKERDRE